MVLQREISISYSQLRAITLFYIALPVLLFLLLWLRASIAFPGVILLMTALLWAAFPWVRVKFSLWSTGHDVQLIDKKISPFFVTSDRARLRISVLTISALLFVAVVWVLLSGIGGFWAQSTDFGARNGIFEDLISHAWPVYYDEGKAALVYYIAFWLPPAFVAKIALQFGASISVAMAVGDTCLVIWASIGIVLVELLLLVALRASSTRQAIIMATVLIFFSGLDIIGIIARALYGSPDAAVHAFSSMHLEQWAGSSSVQFSSNTTLLFWVFNQTIISWLGILLILVERNPSRYVLIALPCFASGPYPFLGIVAICLLLGILSLAWAIRQGESKVFFANVFSPCNLIALLLSTVFIAFFLGSQSVATSGERMSLFGLTPGASIKLIAFFFIIEVGAYAALLFRRYGKCALFWITFIPLLFLPFIHFGSTYEVCFRSSIPFLFIICLFSMHMLIDGFPKLICDSIGGAKPIWLLVIVLLIGSVTPLFEFARGVVSVSRAGISSSLQPPMDLDSLILREGEKNNFKAATKGNRFFTLLAQPYEGDHDD